MRTTTEVVPPSSGGEHPLIFRQNVDRIVRVKDYDQFGDKLLVTSIFRTLQGEAPFSGYPAIFLRLAGCNFGNKDPQSACQWCDTFFAFDSGTQYAVDELLSKIEAIRQPQDILVITGGEPTLQHNLLAFLEEALTVFHTIQVETNGTQVSFFKRLQPLSDQGIVPISRRIGDPGLFVVASPKGVYKAGKIPPLSDAVLSAVGALKFVVEADPTSPHHAIPKWAIGANPPVYVSPMAVYRRAYAGEVSSIWDAELINQEATARNYVYAAQYAIENNLRLSLQTHLITSIA